MTIPSAQYNLAKAALKGVKVKKKLELETTRKRKEEEEERKAKHVRRQRGGAQPIKLKGN